jgi:PAS domain S-box-containing protein
MPQDDKQPTERLYLAQTLLKAVSEEEVDAVIRNKHLIMLRLREVEERLRLSEARYRSIVESQDELVCRWMPDRTLTFVNDAFCRFYQQPREELIGKTFAFMIHERDVERVGRHLAELGPEKLAEEIECREISGEDVRWVNWSNRAVVDPQGRIVEFQSVGRDVSGRKNMEEELLKSRKKLKRRVAESREKLRHTAEVFQTILEEIPVLICLYDESGRISFVNRACEQLLGWSLEEARRTDLLAECFPDLEYRARIWDYMKEDTCEWRDVEIRRRDGSYLDSAWSNVRLPDGSRIGIGIDISRRKEAETAVQQMSRRTLEALENDRQAVAKELHDSIGASLAAIKFSLEARVESMGHNPDPDKMSFEQIIAHLVQTIKETKRISARLRPSALDDLGLVAALNAHIREFCEFYLDIQLILQIEIADQEVPEALKIVLYRVLQEALNNVGKHSRADTAQVKLVRAGDFIELTIEDDGCGFDPKNPLNETDPLRGYGLRSMRERVEICGGRFRIRSEVGRGCSIFVSLPLS